MAEKINWGVLGNAEIARVCVIPAIQRSGNGLVRALATRSPESGGRVVATNHIKHLYRSYDDLLADPEIQAVYIPLPNHLHHPWTLKALQAGKHVLCEKPLACNEGEAQEMVDAATNAGLLLMEGLMYRFHPRSQRIKEMAANGAIGSIYLVRSAFCYPMDSELLKSGHNARLKPDMGGGVLLDVGCYGVSVARWLLDKEPTLLQAQAVFHPAGVDVHLVGSLRFSDDGFATLEASFISALQQTYSIVGSEGAIELPHDAFIPWEKDSVFTVRRKDQEVGQEHVVPGVDEYRLMVEHFADAVSGKTVLALSPQESIRNMRVLDALAKAARTGSTVALEPDTVNVSRSS
ncbi:MAG: Gfo/Idh/MocA family oxidoreductase [Deltaproteobacteria bacterium]|nr:MAG: Gfo/Idh/MocA family oxidoreductase [Deltaproteobacteria bacterium]